MPLLSAKKVPMHFITARRGRGGDLPRLLDQERWPQRITCW